MKKITEIKKEKPYYFVSINDEVPFESESITDCKNFLAKYVKEHKKEIEENDNAYDFFVGMYSITLM